MLSTNPKSDEKPKDQNREDSGLGFRVKGLGFRAVPSLEEFTYWGLGGNKGISSIGLMFPYSLLSTNRFRAFTISRLGFRS